jgi:hypothetical protein
MRPAAGSGSSSLAACLIALTVSLPAALAGQTGATGQAETPAGTEVPAVPSTAAKPDSAPDLSSQATDPTASLMSFNFIFDFQTSYHDLDDSGFEFRFQPVIPFRVWSASSILRVVVPYQVGGPGNEGLKSVSIFDVVVLPQKWGRLAIGPVMTLVESASEQPAKFSIGPAVGAIVPVSKTLNLGLFNQNLFGNGVAITQLQPIVAYQLGHGWALSAGDLQFTYDWERGGFVAIPIGFQVGVVRPVAGQPVRFALNPQWNLKDIPGTTKTKLVFTVTLLAPAK